MPELKPDQWDVIRSHFERGRSPYQIARIVPFRISRQAIDQRAKREKWERKAIEKADSLSDLAIPDNTDSRKAALLVELSKGLTITMACANVGISRETYYNWIKDPDYLTMARRSQVQPLAGAADCLARAAQEDPKWASELLKTHPHTRAEFGKVDNAPRIGQIKIGHLIQRDPTHRVNVIDAEPSSDT